MVFKQRRSEERWARDAGVCSSRGEILLGPANPRDGALPQELNKCFPSAEEMCSSQQLLFQSGRGWQTELRAKADATAPPAGSDQPCVCVCVTRWGVSMLKWSWHWEVVFFSAKYIFILSVKER